MMKKRVLGKRFRLMGSLWHLVFAFGGGILAAHFLLDAPGPDVSSLQLEVSPRMKIATDAQIPAAVVPVSSKVEHSDTSATDGFINAWRQDRETCEQWMSMQAISNSYLDAYIIGSQKGATSELTKRLHKLGVRREDMKKEWHYFNKLEADGSLFNSITTHLPILPQELKEIRYAHYKSGFPDDNAASVDFLPGIDRRNISDRTLAYDGTVESFHTDKAAFMAHALTPHAKVIATVRNPIDRALSQFNMVVRSYNSANEVAGRETQPASAKWFHEIVSKEIEKIKECGYDATNTSMDRPTSKMIGCIFGEDKIGFENLLYVTRGLYHTHIATWRNYFPDHRILILSFPELTTGKRETYQDLAKFLCIRPFPEELLKEFEENGSALSYGQQVAKGMANRGTDSYEGEDNSYLIEILPETRKLLNDFYRPANRKLEALLGKKMYDYE